MKNLSQLLSSESTFCSLSFSSKKKVLEKISHEMAQQINCSEHEIFESLFARERLGTTALGNGVAIPHGRVAACEKATAVFILLEKGIDYDAPDGQVVDIVFAIMVPEEASESDLKCLAKIAKTLSQKTTANQIRNAHCGEALFQIINQAIEKDNSPTN